MIVKRFTVKQHLSHRNNPIIASAWSHPCLVVEIDIIIIFYGINCIRAWVRGGSNVNNHLSMKTDNNTTLMKFLNTYPLNEEFFTDKSLVTVLIDMK